MNIEYYDYDMEEHIRLLNQAPNEMRGLSSQHPILLFLSFSFSGISS